MVGEPTKSGTYIPGDNVRSTEIINLPQGASLRWGPL